MCLQVPSGAPLVQEATVQQETAATVAPFDHQSVCSARKRLFGLDSFVMGRPGQNIVGPTEMGLGNTPDGDPAADADGVAGILIRPVNPQNVVRRGFDPHDLVAATGVKDGLAGHGEAKAAVGGQKFAAFR